MLIKYVRNNDKQPVATIACVSVNGKIGVGFAIQNKADQWDKDMGKTIAIGRAKRNATDGTNYEYPEFRTINYFGQKQWIGNVLESEIRTMIQRGKQFFK